MSKATKQPKTKKAVQKKDGKKSVRKSSEKSDFNPLGFRYVDPKSIQKHLEFKHFLEWYTLPSPLRNPNTQKELAKELGVDEDTLTKWTRLEGFFDEVQANLKVEYLKEATDVLRAMSASAKTGNAKNIRNYLEYILGFAQKVRVQDETPPRELTPEKEEELKTKLKSWGITIPTRNEQ